MQVVVTGACTPLGQALLRALVARSALAAGASGAAVPVRRIIAVDRAQSGALFVDERIEYVRGDYELPRFLARMMGVATGSVFHLSALAATAGLGAAPGEGTADDAGRMLDTALAHSVDTTRALIDACRLQTLVPRLVMASALPPARSGDGVPASTDDACTAICELLVIEYARRGLIDARCVRMPPASGSAAEVQALIDAHERPRAAAPAAQIIGLPRRRRPTRPTR
jgi:nucleoside-diphosphate-sugar epimerase